MKILMRLTLLACLILLLQIEIIDILHMKSKQLAMFGNLPHRALGGLYWAQELQPHRNDYAYDYLVEAYAARKEERILEGQTRPVVEMLTISKAGSFPRDKDLQKLRFVIMDEHFRKTK